MLAVPLIGVEPPTWLFLLGVIPAFVGLVAAGILGGGRVRPWWVGVALALFLPIMFLVPFNSIPMRRFGCASHSLRAVPGATRRHDPPSVK